MTSLGVGAVLAPWIGRKLLTSERNAELLQTLSQNTFPCPVPLTVDGRRMEGLERFLADEPGQRTLTLALGLVAQGQPTFEVPESNRNHPLARVWAKSVHPDQAVPETEAHLAVLTQALLREGSGVDFISGPSKLVWIEDGVLLSHQNLSKARFAGCRVLVFLSSKGLGKDLTGFQLLESHEKNRREERAFRLTLDILKGQTPDSESMESQASKTKLGYGIMTGGLFFLKVFPPIALGYCAAGALMQLSLTGRNPEEVRACFQEQYDRMVSGLEEHIP